MFDQATLSSTLGALSIVTWLGAQSPQLYENYKNGSVEGLALPFLISWFWGDFTNFVGCVLTHQLPFQTYLATYFLCVDVALVSQYYYYSRRKPPHDLPPLSESFPYAQGSGPHHPPYLHPRKPSGRRSRSSRSRSGYSNLHHGHPPPSSEGDPMGQSFMSTRSVSTPASSNPDGGPLHTRDHSHQSMASLRYNQSSASLYTTASTNDEPPSPNVTEPRGRTLTRQVGHASSGGGGGGPAFFDPTALATIYGSPSTGGGADYLVHTSQTRLPHHPIPHLPPAHRHHHHDHHHHHQSHQPYDSTQRHAPHEANPSTASGRGSSSRSRPPPPSRRATGIAFLSVGLLFTLGRNLGGGGGGAGGLQGRQEGVSTPAGQAWSLGRTPVRVQDDDNDDDHRNEWRPFAPTKRGAAAAAEPWTTDGFSASVQYRTAALALDDSATRYGVPSATSVPTWTPGLGTASDSDSDSGPEGGDGPDWERIVGRTSAWLCTTLYLTSRLPQIWRNFRRRSVEGLAMTLFFFAFVGNSLYVASILTNPLAQTEPGYLVESTPYLLGSGGTLVFDLMIMVQAWTYAVPRSSSGAGRRWGKRKTPGGGARGEGDGEEAASLLRGDLEEGEAGSDRTPRRGRSRTSASGKSGRTSRDSSASYGRSISSRRTIATTPGGGSSHALYMTRSRSSDVLSRSRDVSASSSRAERGILSDHEFEWDRVEGPPQQAAVLSRGSSFSSRDVRPETILEAGESSVTVRD